MKLTQVALDRNRFTIVVSAMLVLAGIYAYQTMPRAEDPPIIFRFATVTALLPGASAERMERLVSTPIEDALAAVGEVEWTETIARNDISFTVVKVADRYDDPQAVWALARRELEKVAPRLPKGVEGPTLNDTFGEVYGILLSISGGDGDVIDLRGRVDRLRSELLEIGGVADVITLGVPDERIEVRYDDLELADSGADPRLLIELLKAQVAGSPGGTITAGERAVSVEPQTAVGSVRELRGVKVKLPGSGDVEKLGDVLDIEQGAVEPGDEYIYARGKRAAMIGIAFRDDANIGEVGAAVRSLVATYRDREEAAETGVEYAFSAFEPDRVDYRINRFFINLLQSLAIVAVLLVILLGWRSGLLIGGMMPVVVLTTLALMAFVGASLNLVILAGFVLVLGLMVDNHIVVSERILTLQAEGKEPREAALAAVDELHGPLIIAALTTVAGFLPVYLADSTAGEYVAPLFTVVFLTLLVSEVYGLTVTPFLNTLVNRADTPSRRRKTTFERVAEGYEAVVRGALRLRWLVLIGAVVFVGVTVLGTRLLEKQFFPPSDRSLFLFEVDFPSGTAIERTREAAEALDTHIAENLFTPGAQIDSAEPEGIVDWTTFVGRNAPRFVLNLRPRTNAPEYIYIICEVSNARHIDAVSEQLHAHASAAYPDAIVRASRVESGPAIGWPVRVRFIDQRDGTNDPLEMVGVAQGLLDRLREAGLTRNENLSWGDPVTNRQLVIDETAAAENGVLRADIALTAQLALTGVEATRLRTAEGEIPVWLRATFFDPLSLGTLPDATVFPRGDDAEPVPLSAVANLVEEQALWQVIRRNGERMLTLQADIGDGADYSAVDALVRDWRDGATIPAGIAVELAGEGAESAAANASILKQFPLALGLILGLLLFQTRSIRATVIIGVTVPLGFAGAVTGLIVSGQPFGFMAVVGMVALSGIVVNNAILLLDRIRLNREAGHRMRRCIVSACVSRFRPVLLTTATTVGGILPLYLRDNPVWQPLAAALIFGLIVSTVLILFVVPCLCSILYRDPKTEYPSDRVYSRD